MKLNWSYNTDNIDWDALSLLYKIAPLGVKTVSYLKKALKHSMFKCFVYSGTTLIGAGRVIADGVDCAYFCDIVVHPEFQGKGIGKSIVKKLLSLSKGHKK